MSTQVPARTRMFARVLGPFLIAITTAAIARAADMRTILADFGANSALGWIAGAFILLSGLVVIALHQHWRGAAAIMVSLLGWLIGVKGLSLLLLPQMALSVADSVVDALIWWQAGFVAMALIGLYLTYVGWAPARSRHASEWVNSTANLPRAA